MEESQYVITQITNKELNRYTLPPATVTENNIHLSPLIVKKQEYILSKITKNPEEFPTIKGYSIEEKISLKEYIFRHKCISPTAKPFVTDVMARSIIRELVTFLDYFHEDDELILNVEKLEVVTNNSDLIGFYYASTTEQKKNATDEEYQPPKVIDKTLKNVSERVWAIGIILVEILTGERPFSQAQLYNMQQEDIEKQMAQICDLISQQAMDLVLSCLNIEEKQISLKNIIKHNWLEN